jgi:hypothetical protein
MRFIWCKFLFLCSYEVMIVSRERKRVYVLLYIDEEDRGEKGEYK